MMKMIKFILIIFLFLFTYNFSVLLVEWSYNLLDFSENLNDILCAAIFLIIAFSCYKLIDMKKINKDT